jgi:hypothetical protein
MKILLLILKSPFLLMGYLDGLLQSVDSDGKLAKMSVKDCRTMGLEHGKALKQEISETL